MGRHIVVVGGGQAAAQAIFTLRQRGFDGRLTLVAEEPHLPYQRPPLSKKYLAGELAADRLHLRPAAFYQERGVELRLGVRAATLRPASRELLLNDGQTLGYDRLLLTTGSHVRQLNVPGAGLPSAHYLRTIDDADRLRADLEGKQRLVIIGGGYIGLEAAAIAGAMGVAVTLLEAGQRVMERSTGPQVSTFYQRYHRDRGVDIRVGCEVVAIEGRDRVSAVTTRNGERIECDVVLIGIGIVPNVELAAEAGLECDNGIAVDASARTADADIFAAGDCTSHPSGLYQRRIRLESVHNAIEQAKAAAHTLLDEPRVYDDVPWFWSDQFDLKLQSAGIAAGHDQAVIRHGADDSHFAVFYLRDGRLLAVDAVNSPREFMQGRRLIGERATPDPALLSEPGVSLTP